MSASPKIQHEYAAAVRRRVRIENELLEAEREEMRLFAEVNG